MKELAPWLWIAALAVIFWLLIIRPASRRQKQAVELQSALTVGDDVVLTSGIFGTIVGVTDDYLEVSIAAGVDIHVVRGAIASVRQDVEADGVAPLEDLEGPELDDADEPSEAPRDDHRDDHRDDNEER